MNDIFEVLVSSDSNTAIGSARVWNYKTGNCLHYYKSGGTIHSNGLSFVSNDYFIGAEINKPIINVWPVNSQEPLKNLKLVCPGRVNALAVSPDGHYLAAGISEELYIWQIVTGQLLAVVRKHFQPIVKILFTGDGSYLVTGGQDGVAVVWSMAIILSKETMNTSQFEPLQVFSEHAMPVTGMCINGTGRFARLITVSGDHTIKVHELFSGELLVSVIFNEPLSAVVAHPSGHSVFVGMSNGDIRQISFQRPPRTRMHHEETSDSEDTAVFHGHKTLLTALSVSADGWTLASGTREGVVILWDIPSRQKIRTLELGAAVTNLQFVTAIKNMFIEDFTARQTIMTLGRAVVEPGIETCIQVRQTKDLPVPWAHHTDRHRTQVSSSGDSSTPCHMRSKINRLKVANEQLYRFALNCLSEKRKH